MKVWIFEWNVRKSDATPKHWCLNTSITHWIIECHRFFSSELSSKQQQKNHCDDQQATITIWNKITISFHHYQSVNFFSGNQKINHKKNKENKKHYRYITTYNVFQYRAFKKKILFRFLIFVWILKSSSYGILLLFKTNFFSFVWWWISDVCFLHLAVLFVCLFAHFIMMIIISIHFTIWVSSKILTNDNHHCLNVCLIFLKFFLCLIQKYSG